MKEVTAAIILKGNSVLLLRRKQGKKLEGYWEFPGGKIENGKTPQECLEREIFEELGVKCKASQIIAESEYHYEHDSIKLPGILTVLLNHEIKLTVHDKAKWVSLNNILKLKLAPADIPIAKQLLKFKENV